MTRIIGLTMTYDGYIAAAAPGRAGRARPRLEREGLRRPSPGGRRQQHLRSTRQNGIYVVTSRRMLKLVWNGKKLSTDEEDGGGSPATSGCRTRRRWRLGSISRGSGTTPTLMGFGDDPDKLVVIADAARGRNEPGCVLARRDSGGLQTEAGHHVAPHRRPIRIDISQLTIEPSPNVLGYGVAVINGSYPKPVKDAGLPERIYRWRDAASAAWCSEVHLESETRQFDKAWINQESTTPTSWCRSSRRQPA